MEPLEILNTVQIASSCSASWEEMQGDDRVRFCDSCAKHVYNISDLTAAESLRVIEEHAGTPCLRLYRRRDGTILTADCPVGLRYRARRRMLRMLTCGVILSATIQSAVWAYAKGIRPGAVPPAPTGPGVTLSDWSDWALTALGLRRFGSTCFPGQVQGGITPPPPARASTTLGKPMINQPVLPQESDDL